MKPTLLIDVMIGDSFICQLPYYHHGYPTILDDGSFIETYDTEELEKFVLDKRPSLKNKKFHIEFTNQKL